MIQIKFYDLKHVARDICISILSYLSAALVANLQFQEVVKQGSQRQNPRIRAEGPPLYKYAALGL